MSEYYEIFYCLEVSIRKLIDDTMRDAEGANWCDGNKMPQDIKEDIRKGIHRETETGISLRSENKLDYTTFGHLTTIISTNFDLFEAIISNKNAMFRVLKQLNDLRGPIAHCGLLAEDEVQRLELSIKDWFRLLS